MDIRDQGWYWGNIDKNTVSQVLSKEPDGSFVVRNASTPGDFTLSIRYKNQVKLVRIHVQNNRCGFSPEALIYSSVVELINCHRTVSLKSYNEQLDITLLYPIARPDSVASSSSPAIRREGNSSRSSLQNPSSASPSISRASSIDIQNLDPEWQLQLGLERLRIAETAVGRSARLFDAVHSEHERADSLNHHMIKKVAYLEKKIAKLQEVSETQTACIEEETDSDKNEALRANKKIVDKTINELKNERDIVVSQRTRLATVMEQMREETGMAKKRLVSNQEKIKSAYQYLHEKQVHRSKVAATKSHAAAMLAKESMQVSQLLADLVLPWEPAQYLINDSSKEVAANLIMHARNRVAATGKKTDGIFLIRPSASKENKLVLSVLQGDRLSHCLIEHCEQGWGFENGGLHFITIGDFVRYYAHATLEEHNKDIKTVLTQPAL